MHQANDTSYGLQAGVFCRDVQKAWQAIKGLVFGGVIINDVPPSGLTICCTAE
jgi:acyl-CoA reductase-like NAD-dependent aldehyde dehydrogenase